MKERARRFSQPFYPSDNIQCRLEILMGAQAPMAPMLSTPLKPVCLWKLCDTHGTPTFKTEALRLVSNVQLAKRLLMRNERANTVLPCSSSTVTNDALCY